METVIDGVAYVQKPETLGCIGCIGNSSEAVCCSLPTGCSTEQIIWVKKEDVRQQIEVNKAFGHQMPLFPEIEPEVTAEEDEAFQLMDKQVGGDHYQKGKSNMQPWDIALAWNLNGWEMNILKYLLRHRYKNGIEDIDKLIHYAEFIKKNYEELYAPK